MMGLSASIIPTLTGRIFITVSGDLDNTGANGRGVAVQIRTGTGIPPINGAALTGNTQGSTNPVIFFNSNNGQRAPFSLNAIQSGLTLNTAVWIDISLASNGGAGTARARNISMSIIEL